MTKNSQMNEIEIMPGVMPSTDATPSDIPCWADALHIRFDPTTGRPRKIGGWVSSNFDYNAQITGTIRTLYSATINNKVSTIIGAQCYLYSLIGSRLDNIMPLNTSSTAAANSLATLYGTLANNPITTVNGSNTLTIADTSASRFQPGDTITLSGSATTNGVPNTDINTAHVVRSIGTNNYTIIVATSATSSGAGGGAAAVRATGIIQVTKAAHGMSNGDRIKISGAANTGGILAASINKEFVIRNVATNTFDVMTAGNSTSSVTAAGGGATVYFPQIGCGALNQGLGQGYGCGLYGVGLYGTALTSQLGETFPRIWFVDRFGDNITLTPGNKSGVYTWNGDTSIAPTLITNAPTDINYAFVSDNILVTFGHSVENEIFASDQGVITQWTASATNQVFQDIIEGAGRFISHAPVDGYNLIFTEDQTYTFKYIGGALVWQTLLLDSAIGLIGPMARVSVNGYAYWMGQQNFYMFRGGKIEIIPSNIGTQSSMLRYVFDNLNNSQRFKIFAWYNEDFDEIWWHYPSASSNECDRVARFSRKLQCWVPDMINRTAAEYPVQSLSNPRLANVNTLYVHESGANDNGAPLAFSLRSKKFVSGKDTAIQTQVIPDFDFTGTIDWQLRTYNFPQSATAMNDNTYVLTPVTEKIPVQLNGRFWDHTIFGDELDQTFFMGQCFELPQQGPTAP